MSDAIVYIIGIATGLLVAQLAISGTLPPDPLARLGMMRARLRRWRHELAMLALLPVAVGLWLLSRVAGEEW